MAAINSRCGHQHALCDNAWDASKLPPLPKLPPLASISPRPPLGARECHYAEVQFGSHSEWLEVCPTQDVRLLPSGALMLHANYRLLPPSACTSNGERGDANGLTSVTPRSMRPSSPSSLSNRLHPACAAVAHIIASQNDRRCPVTASIAAIRQPSLAATKGNPLRHSCTVSTASVGDR